MSSTQTYTFKWNNYSSHLTGSLNTLLHSQSLVDVTLFAEGNKIKTHRVVLSACSPYFRDIFKDMDHKHVAVVVMGVSHQDLHTLVNYMYSGELTIKSDHLPSLLEAAKLLQIRGLIEVCQQMPLIDTKQCMDQTVIIEEAEERQDPAEESVEMAEEMEKPSELQVENVMTLQQGEERQLVGIITPEQDAEEQQKRRKRRRDQPRKEYSGEIFMAAMEELRKGKSIGEVSSEYGIPRSTLYVKAKMHGIRLIMTRQEYPRDRVTAAVHAVESGASLKQASDIYKIPKTVLWRRVKMIGKLETKSESQPRQSKSPEDAEAQTVGKIVKEGQLQKAVDACRKGHMSQAVASATFQVPKTTIWRRLQRLQRPGTARDSQGGNITVMSETDEEVEISQSDLEGMGESTVIILAHPGDNLAQLQDGTPVIVTTGQLSSEGPIATIVSAASEVEVSSGEAMEAVDNSAQDTNNA